MSTTTKIALGVGAAAALGGGIALATSGGDTEASNPCTGSFMRVDGAWTIVLNLFQDGNAISGNLDITRASLCCSARVITQLTGQINGNTAVVNWTEECASCTGADNCTNTACNGDGSGGVKTEQFTLENDGTVLRNSGGTEHIRQE